MKHVDEFRDPAAVRRIGAGIARIATRPWRIMEICGGQTHAILRYGLDRLLPETVTLLHGPGCPVCVTPPGVIDAAMEIAARPGVILCSFGDMLRVPGTAGSLMSARSDGAAIRMVYSPLDALALARKHPECEVVFLAIGFETTAPATALAVLQAEREGIRNFSLLVHHVLVPPAMEVLLSDPLCAVDGFLAAGHVTAVMGIAAYEPVARAFRIPIVATGFEPADIMLGIRRCVLMLEEGRHGVENEYGRSVRLTGNGMAQNAIRQVFAVRGKEWRGMGEIAASGLSLNPAYAAYDALARFPGITVECGETGPCIGGDVLRGVKKPIDCPAFGTLCTPERPLGAPMVSSEGACAAYHRYRPAADMNRTKQTA